MKPFDSNSYEAEVVKPLRRREGQELPDDLVTRYAIDLAMSDAELIGRLVEVRSHWNKCSRAPGKPAGVRTIYSRFLRADEQLRQSHGEALNRIDWWTRHAAARAGTRQPEIDKLAAILRNSFSELRLVKESQLGAMVGGSLAPDEIDQALRKAGVSKSVPSALPQSAGLDRTVYDRLSTRLGEAQLASVVTLVHPDVTGFWLLTEFRCQPSHSEGLGLRAVEQAAARESRRSGNDAAREVLGILVNAAKTGRDLRELALFHLLQRTRADRGHQVPPGLLLEHLVATGLDGDEARQAVFSVLNENAAAPTDGLARVKELLEEGKLVGAQQALATVTGEQAVNQARDLVRQRTEEVRELRDAAHRALLAGDESAARQELARAVALAGDDQELATELARIPPPPVTGVSVQPEGLGVRVSWRAGTGHEEDTRYRVVRREDRVPTDQTDGTVIGEGTATVFVDTAAPAGRQVGYAVFATTPSGACSRPAGIGIEVLPPVCNAELRVEPDRVEGRWQVHPEAQSVQVRRGTGAGGEPIAGAGRSMFQDRHAAANSDDGHVYTIVARYRRPDGSLADAAPVVVRSSGAGAGAAVAALALTAVAGESDARIELKWRQTSHAEVVIRRAARACEWEFGAVVALTKLAGYGQEVAGELSINGEWCTLTADVPAGHFHYVPFTVGSASATCGMAAELGIAPPVTDLRGRRFGSEVVLSWTWPPQCGVAEVRWRNAAGPTRFRITRQECQSAGGARIAAGTGEASVEVRAVVAAEGGECLSAPTSLAISPLPTAISYTVDMARRPLIGGGKVRVTLTAERATTGHTVVLIAAEGSIMPGTVRDGRELERRRLEIAEDGSVELTPDLPKLRKPFWVRCFLESPETAAPARLIDPPTKQLKVS